MRLTQSLLAASLMALSCNAVASEDLLARFMADTRPAKAQFSQKDRDGLAKGEMVVGSQGKMRWDQKTPYPSLLVSNGRIAWQVDPDLMQATRLDAKMTEGWAGVFGNRQLLEKQYTLEQKNQRITLTPKRRDGVKGVIDFDARGNPVLVKFSGQGSISTEIRFTQWTRLTTPAKALFDYKPTKGMDVIGAQ